MTTSANVLHANVAMIDLRWILKPETNYGVCSLLLDKLLGANVFKVTYLAWYSATITMSCYSEAMNSFIFRFQMVEENY